MESSISNIRKVLVDSLQRITAGLADICDVTMIHEVRLQKLEQWRKRVEHETLPSYGLKVEIETWEARIMSLPEEKRQPALDAFLTLCQILDVQLEG